MDLPRQALPRCADCGAPVNPDSLQGVLMAREITGWSVPRSQGGQNHVVARHETGRLLCPGCTQALRDGHPGQRNLYDAERSTP